MYFSELQSCGLPKRGRPGGVNNQVSFKIFCFFLTFLAAKVPALVYTRPSLSYRHTATHPKDCTGLGDPNTLKRIPSLLAYLAN